jgi:hypothetical protein
MSKENHKNSVVASSGSSNVVKRSPAISGRKDAKTLAGSVLAQSGQRKSISRIISSVGRVLTESERILPHIHKLYK